MQASELNSLIKNLAASLGFDRCGISRADPIGRAAYLRTWLDAGRAGTMEYMHRHFRVRVDPRELLDGARSVIVVALLYRQHEPAPIERNADRPGRIAMYAWGDDYHRIVKARLFDLADRLRAELGDTFEARACVDTAPLMERELAAAAGIGWIGKNTMVIDERLGSFFVLGALITTLEPAVDAPAPDRCGTCTACLQACPTGALTAPYQMDASRCISYLTIEHRGDISKALQPLMRDWVFGCDICQEVCPHNRRAPVTREPRFAIRSPGPRPEIGEIINWTRDDYDNGVRGRAMKRASLDMLKRNTAIALENCGGTDSNA